jgi:PncC family amidohydrolase
MDFRMPHAKTIAKLLTARNQTLATAESCTGGLVSHTITNIPGASNFYKGGVIAYANDTKSRLVGVPSSLIGEHGAVSAPVALAMAKGIRKKTRADFSIAVTGIAGPGGGTRSKPVGLVFIAASSLRKTLLRRFLFKGTRLQVKTQARDAALNMLLKLVR